MSFLLLVIFFFSLFSSLKTVFAHEELQIDDNLETKIMGQMFERIVKKGDISPTSAGSISNYILHGNVKKSSQLVAVTNGVQSVVYLVPTNMSLDYAYNYSPTKINTETGISLSYAKISLILKDVSVATDISFVQGPSYYFILSPYSSENNNYYKFSNQVGEVRTASNNVNVKYFLLPNTYTQLINDVTTSYNSVFKYNMSVDKLSNMIMFGYNILRYQYNLSDAQIKAMSGTDAYNYILNYAGFSNSYEFSAWTELLKINKKLDDINSSSDLSALLEETELQTEAIKEGNQIMEDFKDELMDTNIKSDTEQDVQDAIDFGGVTDDINNDYDSSLMGLINNIINKLTNIPDGEVTKTFSINVFGTEKSFTLSSNQLVDLLPIFDKTFFSFFWWFILGIPTAKLMYGLFVKIKTMKILDGFSVSGIIERII